MPIPETLEKVKIRSEAGVKWKMLAEAQSHATWERTRREQEKRCEDDGEVERGTWTTEICDKNTTNEFTAADTPAELPPPMSVQEVENMTLAQKRMAAMVMETAAEDVEAHRARQAVAEAEAAAVVSSAGGAVAEAADDDVMVKESDDEDAESERKRKEEVERKEVKHAKVVQASSLEAGVPMKSELTMGLNSQRDALEARKAQASELQRGANVVSSVKNLARSRVDIFGTETDEERKREEEDERESQPSTAQRVWDHRSQMLLAQASDLQLLPRLSPPHRPHSYPPTPVDAVSKVPSFTVETTARIDGLGAAFRVPASSERVLPAFAPPASATPPANSTGTVRAADQMEGDAEDVPPAKCQCVAKLPCGQYYPEINMHPVQLPSNASTPEWKMDGTIVTITDLPLNLFVSTLRDRIIAATGSTLSPGKLILSYNGKMLTNRSTIANCNLEEDDLLVLSVRD
ncbi:hypothetical protein BJY52DRAFT_1223673 [Lactarius psammicola]|nr:hypothetical protein BJY52DRAFT_1223673 [Lactarius psammicola]